MKGWALVGAAAGALVAVVAFAPATWMARQLDEASDGRLLLADAQGSVWRGHGVLVLSGGPGSHDASALPGRLHWRLGLQDWRPALWLQQACCLDGTLLLRWQPGLGSWRLDVQPQLGDASVTAAATVDAPGAVGAPAGATKPVAVGVPRAYDLPSPTAATPAAPSTTPPGPASNPPSNPSPNAPTAAPAAAPAAGSAAVGPAIGHWPVAWLAGLGAPLNTLRLSGSMVLSAQGLSFESVQGRMVVRGQADLALRQVASRMSTLPVLGDYHLRVQGDPRGQTATLQLRTAQGALQLSGEGQWVASRLRFNGQAAAAPGSEAALNNLLNIIGRRQGALSLISIGST